MLEQYATAFPAPPTRVAGSDTATRRPRRSGRASASRSSRSGCRAVRTATLAVGRPCLVVKQRELEAVYVAGVDDFDLFYRGSAPRLLRYALGLGADVSEAQDLVQEAYARAWQRWSKVCRYEDTEGWLRLVVSRLVTDRWRRLGIRRAASARFRPPPPVAPPSEDVVMLVAALRTLPIALRRALTLHYLLDRSIDEIAQETGASTGTVKSWLSRGRVRLAAALGEPVTAAVQGDLDAR